MYKTLVNINERIYKILKVLIMFLLLGMSAMVFSQVVARALGKPLAWSEELSTYFFSWITYFGAVVVYKNDGHIRITAFIDKIKNERFKKGIIIFSQILILVFVLGASYYSATMVRQFHRNDQRAVNIDFLKMAYVFLQVPLSNAFFGLFTIQKIIETVNKEYC